MALFPLLRTLTRNAIQQSAHHHGQHATAAAAAAGAAAAAASVAGAAGASAPVTAAAAALAASPTALRICPAAVQNLLDSAYAPAGQVFFAREAHRSSGGGGGAVRAAAAAAGDSGPSAGGSVATEAAKAVVGADAAGAEHKGRGASRPLRTGPVTWGSLALLLVTGGGLLWYFEKEKQRRLQGLKQVRSVGKAAIGGPFALVDHDGNPITHADLKGPWNLLYFGFTFCPDICPAELEKMAEAVDLIEKKGGPPVRPVFVSVDPERDTPEQVKAYVKEFHPKLLGLTGTPEAVKAAAREFRVYYMKTEEEGDDYLVDHSIIMYLMDPNMEFVKFFGRNHTSESLADGIVSEIKAWSPSSSTSPNSPAAAKETAAGLSAGTVAAPVK